MFVSARSTRGLWKTKPHLLPSTAFFSSSAALSTPRDLKDVYKPIPVLKTTSGEGGFVRLVDHMPYAVEPPLYCDAAIAQMARISYGAGTKKTSSDQGLIRYLMRKQHTSPFEAVEFKFHLKIPIFVERQLIRHRTASVNQISGRYSVLPEDYYVPDAIRKQAFDNKQGSEGILDEIENMCERRVASNFRHACRNQQRHQQYKHLVNTHHVAREVARIMLSQNLMTELYWKIDLHNLFHFLHLRQDRNAQQEIRSVADALFSVVQTVCPVSTQAFLDYRVDALTFSACEIRALQEEDIDCIPTQREQREFKEKMNTLGQQKRKKRMDLFSW